VPVGPEVGAGVGARAGVAASRTTPFPTPAHGTHATHTHHRLLLSGGGGGGLLCPQGRHTHHNVSDRAIHTRKRARGPATHTPHTPLCKCSIEKTCTQTHMNTPDAHTQSLSFSHPNNSTRSAPHTYTHTHSAPHIHTLWTHSAHTHTHTHTHTLPHTHRTGRMGAGWPASPQTPGRWGPQGQGQGQTRARPRACRWRGWRHPRCPAPGPQAPPTRM
jgi:hypothetical protein